MTKSKKDSEDWPPKPKGPTFVNLADVKSPRDSVQPDRRKRLFTPEQVSEQAAHDAKKREEEARKKRNQMPNYGYNEANATRRRPQFGWDNGQDIARAEHVLKAGATVDKECLLLPEYLSQLYALAIRPSRAFRMFQKAFPRMKVSKEYAKEVYERTIRFYCDHDDDPGAKSNGKSNGEESSDGTWQPGWDHTNWKPLGEWQWISSSMQFVHNDGRQTMNEKQFEMGFGRLSHDKKIVTKIQRGDAPMKRFAAQVFIPKKPPVLCYQGPPAMPFEGRVVFNLWRDSGMTPKPGDHQWFVDHVARLFPGDERSQQLVIDFMAQLVQHPEVKMSFALLIQSADGAGKGALARILRRMIGDRNTVEPSNDEVTKTWSGWQENAQLVIVNELMAGGRYEVLNRLKSPITEDTLRIEKKFGNTFSIPNYMNFFCMTNFKDALPLTLTDRRWLVVFSPLRPTKADEPYYNGLFANIADDSKIAAALDFLLKRKIGFNPKGHAPMTDAKAEMQQRAQTDIVAQLTGLFELGHDPFDVDVLRREDIVFWLEANGRKNTRGLGREVDHFLDGIQARPLRRYKHAGSGIPQYRLVAIRDHAAWDAKSPKDVATKYHARVHPIDPSDDEGFG